MKILILSKSLLAGTYQQKLELLASSPQVELVAVIPPYWREPGVGKMTVERIYSRGYRLLIRPIALNGHFHLYFWPFLGRLLRQERPDILHIDEEAFNLSTFQAMRLGQRLGARCLFFNWANIYRGLPPPFSWMERYNLARADYAVAGNHEAAQILRQKGYQGPLAVIPQFGVDAYTFRPQPSVPLAASPQRDRGKDGRFLIGYFGRLVPQKGILDLIEALAGLPDSVQLLLVGDGVQEPLLRQRVARLGLSWRVTFKSWRPSTELPRMYAGLDAFVLPSHTFPNWKEQFGRVLIEAMACGVPVIGSDSGEIPHVIGQAGLTFPEGDVQALRERLERLRQSLELRAELGRRGRIRVLEHYTQERVVQSYLNVYQEMAR